MSANEQNREMKSFLGGGTEFNGVLSFEGAIRIDGKLEGEVISNDMLVIGEKAVVSADISIGTIIIMGKITGNITASQKIEIKKGGSVVGNIKSPAILIEFGAIFDGNCEMSRKDVNIAVLPKKNDNDKKNIAPTAA